MSSRNTKRATRPREVCFSATFDPKTPHDNLISLSAVGRYNAGVYEPQSGLTEKRPKIDRNSALRWYYNKRSKNSTHSKRSKECTQCAHIGPTPPEWLRRYFTQSKKSKPQRTNDGKPLNIVGTIEVNWDELECLTNSKRRHPKPNSKCSRFLVVENLAFDMVFSFRTMRELGVYPE